MTTRSLHRQHHIVALPRLPGLLLPLANPAVRDEMVLKRVGYDVIARQVIAILNC